MFVKLKLFRTLTRFLLVICFACISLTNAYSAGQVDPGFNPLPSKALDPSTAGGNLTIQPDGKIIIFGSFQVVNGVVKNRVARLNTDGSLDNSFNCAVCDSGVYSVFVQPNGKIIGSGSNIRRFNSDGSVDNSFNSPFTPNIYNSYYVWAVQPDGKIIVQNSYTIPNQSGTSLSRLNSDGTLDNTFTTITFTAARTTYQFVTKVLLTPDGKILVSGGNAGMQSLGFLNRFNSNGTLDLSFESPSLGNTFDNSTLINDLAFNQMAN